MNSRLNTRSEDSSAIRLAQMKHGVEDLRRVALEAGEEFGDACKLAAPPMRASAINFAHYLAVRRHDVRPFKMNSCAMDSAP